MGMYVSKFFLRIADCLNFKSVIQCKNRKIHATITAFLGPLFI